MRDLRKFNIKIIFMEFNKTFRGSIYLLKNVRESA